MNVKLLRQVKRHIQEEPKRLNMSEWGTLALYLPKNRRPACGTVACIAGWACLLNQPELIGVSRKNKQKVRTFVQLMFNASGIAQALLGLTPDEGGRLFHVTNWPEEFKYQYWNAEQSASEAKITAARIEHFIKTKGEE